VDTTVCNNGVVEKLGAASGPSKGSNTISPSMACHGDTTHQRTHVEAEAHH
jgi:hypothetical protein